MSDEVKIKDEYLNQATLELLVAIYARQEVFQQLLLFNLSGGSSERLEQLKSVYLSEYKNAHTAITEKLFELYGFVNLGDLLPPNP